MYTYVKGKGWVLNHEPVHKVYELEHDGRRYRVTLLERPAREGERSHYDSSPPIWLCDFEGIPAGFGGGTLMGMRSGHAVITAKI